jgi:hypothetical protein
MVAGAGLAQHPAIRMSASLNSAYETIDSFFSFA